MILLVDDEAIVREVGSELLSILGYQAICASEGPEALELLSAAPDGFRLAILDMTMPRMAGPELFRHIRDLNPNIRVLFSSGYTLDDTGRDLVREGGVDYIQKPFDLKTLSLGIQNLLA
ncbi:MAG: hypothetical protein CSB33_01870 [Desulfobacterales bacterium]|nr:MAG: hypothetical protein CSB33_01870 [Desulfobacterales bacterium]